jgi:hypothetical protein
VVLYLIISIRGHSIAHLFLATTPRWPRVLAFHSFDKYINIYIVFSL